MPEPEHIRKLKGDKNICHSRTGEGHCCVIDWGTYNYTCPHLAGVFYKGEFYDVQSDEFKRRFDENEIDHSLLEWGCLNPLPTWIKLHKMLREGKEIL